MLGYQLRPSDRAASLHVSTSRINAVPDGQSIVESPAYSYPLRQVGAFVGAPVGAVGVIVGVAVGAGESVGVAVGIAVGDSVTTTVQTPHDTGQRALIFLPQ
jgi:hypothetical protein